MRVNDMVEGARNAWVRVTEAFDKKRLAWRSALLDNDGRLSVAGEIALRDLARFCDAGASTARYSPVTGSLDPLASAKADGRREVFLRVVRYLNLSPIEAMRLAGSEG